MLNDQLLSNNILEKFIINNKDLSVIESHLNKFNPIRVMKMERMEVRHSAILGWLLNPRENHGLGDRFLRSFLSEALKGYNQLSSDHPSALDINSATLMDINVYIEWNNIDIFIECPHNKWVFVIENKVYSSQHSDQLVKYKEFIKKRYKKSSITGVFLTLLDEDPEDDYCTIKYGDVLHLLEMILQQHKDSLSSKVHNFIMYYFEVVSELCGMNEDENKMQDLAKKIYRENKRVLDFIYEHGASTEFQYAVTQLLKVKETKWGDFFEIDEIKYQYYSQSKSLFCFLPEVWVKTLGELGRDDNSKLSDETYKWKGCESWWWQYPLICWFQLEKSGKDEGGKLKLIAEIGPLDEHTLRINLIEAINNLDNKQVSFTKNAYKEGAKYSKFLTSKIFSMTINDLQDAEQISEGFNKLLERFGKEVVQPVNEALEGFMKNN